MSSGFSWQHRHEDAQCIFLGVLVTEVTPGKNVLLLSGVLYLPPDHLSLGLTFVEDTG